MNAVRWSMLVYGLCLIAMGVQSFFFPHEGGKPSIISLIAAGGMGCVALGFTYWAVKAANPRGAYIAMIVLALLVPGRFIGQLARGAEVGFYPGMLTIILSVAMILVLGMGHMNAQKKKRSEPTN